MHALAFLKRTWIWGKRFRYRKGYGVHSPFAFHFITAVIQEKGNYYAYKELNKIRLKLIKQKHSLLVNGLLNRKKNDQLLFRLVNYTQPQTILEIGTDTGLSTLYLAEAAKKAQCITLDNEKATQQTVRDIFCGRKNIRLLTGELLPLTQETILQLDSIDFLYVHFPHCTPQIWNLCIEKASPRSLFIIEGIHRTDKQSALWKKYIADPCTGITFDLYDLGIIFFDKTKIKQHYIVNF